MVPRIAGRGIVKLSRFGRDGVQRARLHAAAVASRHCAAASDRKIRRVERETRCRCRLNVLWTAACMLRKRWAEPGDLKHCSLRSRRSHHLVRVLGPIVLCALPRCTVLPGERPGRQTLAPAGSIRRRHSRPFRQSFPRGVGVPMGHRATPFFNKGTNCTNHLQQRQKHS